jgi:large subunit ribosomal protein L19
MARNKMELMKKAEGVLPKDKFDDFNVGDIVDIHLKVKEGDKERIQIFSGLVIGRKGSGASESFTVRRVVGDEGVERMFPLNAPSIDTIKLARKGKVRRAKLYYMRGRMGKQARIAERREDEEGLEGAEGAAAPPAPEAKK